MVVSYKKLWKLLIDKDMKKVDLRKATGISSFTLARMTHGEDVGLDVLKRICEVLHCDVRKTLDEQIVVNERMCINYYFYEASIHEVLAKLLYVRYEIMMKRKMMDANRKIDHEHAKL